MVVLVGLKSLQVIMFGFVNTKGVSKTVGVFTVAVLAIVALLVHVGMDVTIQNCHSYG